MERERDARRTVRCGLHGRFYDAWSARGCPDCAKRSRSRTAGRGGGWSAAPLLLAGALGLAYWQGRLPVLANTVHVAPAPAPAQPLRLDPTPYRAEIEALEAVLYRDGRVALGDAERVAAAARALGDRLARDLDRVAGSRALLRLGAFAMEVEARAEAGYALPDLAGPRRDWERLRAELFQKAAWLRREGPALAAAQRPPPPRADLLDVQAHERFAKALAALLADGRRELMAPGEPSVDVAEGSAAEARLARAWADLSRDWEQRVSRACAKAPAAPAQGDDLHLVMAHQQLGDACHQLRLATVAPGEAPVPMKSWRQASLDQAAARISEARAQLEDATRF
jgi:hypothetical protein